MNKRFSAIIFSFCVIFSAAKSLSASDYDAGPYWNGKDDGGKKGKTANLGTLSYMPVVATVVSK